MANTTFVDNTTVIVSAWLNDINDLCYEILGNGTSTPTTAAALRTNISAAVLGANSDITSLSACTVITGMTTPLTVAQGGSGAATFTDAGVLLGNGTGAFQVTTAGTSGQVLTSNGAGVDPTFQVAAGRLIGVQVITATGTYTPTAGTASIQVELLGGGGGGGGCATTAATQVTAGGGGGAGAYAKARITSGFSGVTVTIGAAGAAGTAGNNNGGNGGDSTFGAVLTAGGGVGGIGSGAAGAAPRLSGAGSAGGTASGSANLFASRGENGTTEILTVNTIAISGAGGSTLYGSGGIGAATLTVAAGNAGTGFGSGGSGGACIQSQTQRAGGAGTAGLCIIWEYS